MNHPGVERALGVTAAGASSAPTPVYGEFLTTHGLWLLSYAEWLQVLGGIYIIALLGKMTGLWRLLAKWWKK